MKNMYEDRGEHIAINIVRKGEYYETLVDKMDFDKVSSIVGTWHLNNRGYVSTTKNKKRLGLHRFILNAPFGKLVDHKDGDPLNNRKNNLRIVDPEGNVQNIRNHNRNSSSGVKGAKFDSDMNLWRSQINHKRNTIHLGYYEHKEDAGLAYSFAKALLHSNSIEAGIFDKIYRIKEHNEF